MIRENPWLERRPSFEHFRRFDRLMRIRLLTQEWLGAVSDGDNTGHELSRVSAPEAARSLGENRRLIETFSEASSAPDLEKLLDDQMPSELLDRIHQVIWTLHAWTLDRILRHTPASEKSALKNALEQASFRNGRADARRRSTRGIWMPRAPQRPAIPEIFKALESHPLGCVASTRPFLIHRATRKRVEAEWLQCPHQSTMGEVRAQADTMCPLHGHWFRGFVYELDPGATLHHEVLPAGGRGCQFSLSDHRFASDR